ncbi:MAG TPA: hypothetical protein VKG63_13665 [Steroidobacteraceae bacterium]|nr:hypothetical protein [Steroidobacteraceae bacterium]
MMRAAGPGYPLPAAWWLTGLALLGAAAGALAGTIEGGVAFPSQLVPAMTVYAANLDTSRVHTVQLARGQSNFTIEVPPGRYLVFLTPNELGAPDVYGAYTQYSLCTPHDVDGKCEDHALVPVAVSAKAPRAAVTVDDWYLTDEIAGQLDRIRGVAVGLYSEPLSAPRFSEYPSASFDAPAPPKIDFSGSELSRQDREAVQIALSSGPNFAGHVTAALTNCGPACGRLVLVDWIRGQLQVSTASAPPLPLSEIQGTLPCRPEEAVLFRRDSRLLSITRMRGTAVVTQYYVWNPDNAALVPSGEYQRTAEAFCAVAAR